MEPKSPSKLKVTFAGSIKYKRVLKICVTLVAVIILLVGTYHTIVPGKVFNVLGRSSYFTVVVDCGSSGTRVDVYEWLNQGVSGRNLPILVHVYPNNSTKSNLWKDGCEYHCMQTEPGLDKFVGNSSGVRASLEPLIFWAEQQIPYEKHQETPIFILATAGLRQLPVDDSRLVLEDVEAVVKECPFMYKKNWIRVLSGKEEAYYGWISLNFKMGILEDSSAPSTLGLLDLGGSSLQVVIEIDGSRIDGSREDEHFVRSKIGSIEHRILAYSLPAFGLNKAFDRTIAMLSQAQSTRETGSGAYELRHPCLSSSFLQNYTCNSCSGPSTSAWKNSGEKWNYHSNSVVLAGDPNWEQCKGLARAAAVNSHSSDWSQESTGSNCKAHLPFNGSSLLNITAATLPVAHFHALSGFFAVYNMLNLSARANITKIWERGQHLCSTYWIDSSTTTANNKYAGQYCFRVPYLASLIEDALCLGDSEVYVGPGDVSWTLGAALVEGNHSWVKPTQYQTRILAQKIRDFLLSPIFILFCFVFLSSLFIIFKSSCLCYARRVHLLGHPCHLTHILSTGQISVRLQLHQFFLV